MIPLSFAKAGESVIVARVGGNDEERRHLEDLGFIPGARVTVVADTGDGNIIVNVKESRLAITSQMAAKIHVA